MSREEWIHGEGRLGEGPAGQRPAGPAGTGQTLGDMLGGPEPGYPHMICWRCGAQGYQGGPCTEKRGDGPPWRHQYADRRWFHPWADYSYAELLDLAHYLAGKSLSSLATAKAFGALVRYGDRLGFAPEERQNHLFARALYADKAAKRIRLLDWALDELDRRKGE